MADREHDREGFRLDPEHIILTNGSMQAITLVARALCRGRDDPIVARLAESIRAARGTRSP